MKKALIILSGGLDSATCLYLAKNAGFQTYAITFDYAQKLAEEIGASEKLCKKLNVPLQIVKLPIGDFKGSSLTDTSLTVPEQETKDIPNTYVPARNLVFLSVAAAFAEVNGIYDIFIGVNSVDYSGYPDCRPEFIKSFSDTVNLGTKQGVNGQKFAIHTPLIDLSKAKIIELGLSLKVDYSLTISCYNIKNGIACGKCSSCKQRLLGFKQINVKDPVKYLD